MNKIGSLYQVKKRYWFVFPSKETVTAAALRHDGGAVVESAARYWSNQYNCNVTYVSPNDIFVLLEKDGKFKKVLTTNGTLGWAWFEDVYTYNKCFEEVRAE